MRNAGPSEQRYGTPPHLVRAIELEMRRRFDLDAGAEAWSAKAERFYTIDDDGLAQPWAPFTFYNPPYSDQQTWLGKAVREAALRGVLSVGLVQAAVSNRYFRPATYEVGTIDFYEGRIAYLAPPEGVRRKNGSFIAGGEPVDGADFASCLVWIGPGARRHTVRWRDAKTGLLISAPEVSCRS